MHHLTRATYTGGEEILSGFETINPDSKYCYSIWCSLNDIAFQCTAPDGETQKEQLTNYLGALEKAGNTDLLYIKCHPGDMEGYITKKTPVISVTPIRVNPIIDAKLIGSADTVGRPQGMSYEAWEIIKGLKDLPATIDAKIEAKLAELLIDEAPEDPTQRLIGQITGVMNNPSIMAMLGQILNFLKPGASPAQQRIGMINGNDQAQDQQPAQNEQINFDEELMNESLNRLRFHMNLGADLKLLADLADKDPKYFSGLLNILRS